MNKETVREFYLMAQADIDNGFYLQEMYLVLDWYSEHRNYEACYGIQLAIEERIIQTFYKI